MVSTGAAGATAARGRYFALLTAGHRGSGRQRIAEGDRYVAQPRSVVVLEGRRR
jgi:hypothetical protein